MSKLNRPSLLQLVDRKELIGAEIGVFKGHNAKSILDNLDISKIYLIENWSKRSANKEACIEFLKDYSHKIEWLHGDSEKMADRIPDEELDFVYIDSLHTELQATKELESYYPKVKRGGLVCGHDYQVSRKSQVKFAVDGFFGPRKLKINSALCWKINGKEILDWWVWKR